VALAWLALRCRRIYRLRVAGGGFIGKTGGGDGVVSKADTAEKGDESLR